MAALLKFSPAQGASTTAEAIAQLKDVVRATLHPQMRGRPVLVCRWLEDADGRLSCHWEIEVPNVSIPPH
jgi:hypothetical protein